MNKSMPTISVRITDEMRHDMEKYPTINWSEVLRQAITQKLTNKKDTNLVKAVLLNEKIRKNAPKDWDSTAFIKEDRRRTPKINTS